MSFPRPDSEDGAAQEQDQQEPPAETPSLDAKATAGAAADGGAAKAPGHGAESAAESDDESDDAAAGGSNAGTDDDVKAVAPKNMDRISNWVVSKGEVFQNQAPAGAWGTPGSNADGLADVDGDEGALQLMAGAQRKGFMPTAGKAAAAGGGSGKWVAAEPRKGAGGAMVAPPPMEAREDDAMSDGGQSAMSGVSAASTGAEYKRGKRFRNLVKLMDSSAAEQILRRFRYGALLTGAVLAISHIICFVLVVTSIKDQQHAMTQLVVAGRAQLFLSRVMVTVRALDQIYKGRAPPNLYSLDDAKAFAEDIMTYAAQVKDLNNQVMAENRNQPIIQDQYYFIKVMVWSGINTTSGEDIFERITLWDMATKVFMSAKDIYQNHASWAATGVNVSDTPSGQFLLMSGETFFTGHRKVMDSLLYIAMENTSQVNTLQVAFLIAEGCGVSLLAAALITYLLRRLAAQRYTLYGTFLAIPVGLTRALTSQITNSLLLEEDEDEDGDDDEAQKAALSGDPKQKRRATVDMPAGAGEAATGDAGGKDAADPLTPAGRGGALLRRSTTNMENSVPSRSGWLANCLSCVCFRNPKVMPRTISGVDAWGDGGAGAGAGADAAAKASKRTLKRDSHDTLLLLTPFMLWSTLVFIFYAVSVAQLQGVDPLVAMASVSNLNTARSYRTCFYAQELAAEEDPAMLPTRRAGLLRLADTAKEAFYTLQLGKDAYKALGPSTERFPSVTAGLSYETSEMANLFYSNQDCLRAPPTPPCPGPEYRFYEATHAGLDSIQQVYLGHAFALANDLSNDTVGLNNSRFDFIYNVGTKDLADANVEVGTLHFDFIQGTFSNIMMLHVLLFVMLWVCLAGFLFLLLNPLVKRYKKEKRRIAELMSQLPLELDVEKLVGRALGAAGNPSDTLVQNGATAAAADQGHSDAAKAWKNVLRSAASNAAGTRGAKGELAARVSSLR